MINPGDKLVDFLITTGVDEGVTYMSKLHCPVDYETSTESCKILVGTKVNVSNSFNRQDLEAVWARHTYEMSIEGRPVNLEAFGPVDTTQPVAGKLRNWIVVIASDKPGTISIQGKAELDGETVEMNVILTFIQQ